MHDPASVCITLHSHLKKIPNSKRPSEKGTKRTPLIDRNFCPNDVQRQRLRELITAKGYTAQTLGEAVHKIYSPCSADGMAQSIRKLISDSQKGHIDLNRFAKMAELMKMTAEDTMAFLDGVAVTPATKPVNSETQTQENDEQANFARFFGDSVSEMTVQLLLPKRELADWVTGETESPFKPEPMCDFDAETRNVWAKGISGYLAFEDAAAALHLTSTIMRLTHRPPWLRQENSRACLESIPTGTCYVSFGLGFSAATRITEEHFEPYLYRVHRVPWETGNYPGRFTDGFRIKRRGKTNACGFEELDDIPPLEGKDVALIVRVVPSRKKSKTVHPYFICAGRSAHGTEAAGYFLAYRWEELLKRYPDDDDTALRQNSLAAVIIYDIPTEPRIDALIGDGQSFVESAELHFWDKEKTEPCIAFGAYIPKKKRK